MGEGERTKNDSCAGERQIWKDKGSKEQAEVDALLARSMTCFMTLI